MIVNSWKMEPTKNWRLLEKFLPLLCLLPCFPWWLCKLFNYDLMFQEFFQLLGQKQALLLSTCAFIHFTHLTFPVQHGCMSECLRNLLVHSSSESRVRHFYVVNIVWFSLASWIIWNASDPGFFKFTWTKKCSSLRKFWGKMRSDNFNSCEDLVETCRLN